ncbi:hypothetical protein CITRIK5_70885 [Citricoccus sp. K5]|nr:hypothetical protein CITRIK5_70885 [Citricoccus sp. K5]
MTVSTPWPAVTVRQAWLVMLVLLFVILASARLVIGQVSLTIIAGIAGIAIFTRRRLMASPLPNRPCRLCHQCWFHHHASP